MPRRKSLEIQAVQYHENGALLTIFVPGAGPDTTPMELLSGVAAARGRGAKRTVNKAAAILEAIRGGANKPSEIVKRTGLPNKQIHAYIAYHKKRGNIKGDAKKGFTVTG